MFTHLKAMGCLNPGGQRGFPLSSTAQQTLTLISPDVSRIPASGREGWGSPPAFRAWTIIIIIIKINDERFYNFTW